MARSDRIIPEMFVDDGPGAIDFYQRAFGATEISRMMAPDGKKLLHAELEVAGHRLFVCDEFPASDGGTCRCPRTLGGTGVRLMLEVDNADRTVERAIAAGAKVLMPVQDMFWGARYGKLLDPFGHEWGINQQMQQLTEAEETKKAHEYFSKR